MTRSGNSSSNLLPCHLRTAAFSAAMFAGLGLTGCAETCVFVTVNGGFQIDTTKPASVCGLSQSRGAVTTSIVKSVRCEFCTSSARVEHLYVTLRGVQLHSSTIANQNSPDWLEIAPQLANNPRQMDLIGHSEPEILLESTAILSGSYRQVRLEFLPDAAKDDGHVLGKNECGAWRNCIAMGDGSIHPVYWPRDVSELLITGESVEGGTLVVLPGTMMALRISLEPRQLFFSSKSAPWVARVVLVGRASSLRQSQSPA